MSKAPQPILVLHQLMNAAPFFGLLFSLDMERDRFPLPISSLESLRGSRQSLSCWRYGVLESRKNQNARRCPCCWKMHIHLGLTWIFPHVVIFPASTIQRRQHPRWFRLWHLGPGAGYREDHGQHQMGDWEQRTSAEVAHWWDCMRSVHLSEHRLTNRLFRTVVKDDKTWSLDRPDVTI